MATPDETSQAAVEAAERLLELKFPQMDGSCYASLKTTAAGSAGRVPIGRLSSEQALKARQAPAMHLMPSLARSAVPAPVWWPSCTMRTTVSC